MDVAVRTSHSVLALAFRDHEGSLCTVYTERIPHPNPLVGETAALLAAIRLSSSFSGGRLEFESDCSILVNDVHCLELRTGWLMEEWLVSIRRHFSDHSSHSLTLIPRRRNRLAHQLTKWAAATCSFGFCPVVSIPVAIVIVDSVGGWLVFPYLKKRRRKGIGIGIV
ncbi:hypothetical protein CJ030_MR8G019140 [Morella rubra]|uniref:RNase H type-1 domain-containing protein n=1 Tax=Morella rubra TaxID=262757 RepID=A0A6A1URA8_9ROSI|nr:hypothetical protein CJ030_MR8G019140 [Morella rubra]